MIFINRQVNNHYSMGDTHFLQICYLLLNRNAPYYVFLQKYASQFGIHNLFYSINNFVFINKNLYITSSNMVTGYNIKIRPINKQLLQSLYFNTAFPSREFFQKFYHQLSLAIKDKPHYTEKDITYYPNSFFLTHDNKVFNVRFSTNKIEVLDKVLPFVFNKNYCFAKQQLTDFNTLLSKQSIQLLHTLSFGSINKLLEIASLWAMISTNTYYALEKSKRVLYIINCSSEVRSILKDFFNNCALKSPLFDGFNSITKKNALAEIIMYPLNNINYIASVSSKRMESPLQKATILKLIQGTTISFQNDIGLPMRLKNKIPIICFSDSQKDIKRISEEYPSEILNIDFDIDTYTNICKELTQEDYTKIATFLSLLGLYYRTSTNILKKDAMTSDTPVDIITSFCQPAEGHYLYFEDIYNIYLQYCKYACINTPLTSIVFNKIRRLRNATIRINTAFFS